MHQWWSILEGKPQLSASKEQPGWPNPLVTPSACQDMDLTLWVSHPLWLWPKICIRRGVYPRKSSQKCTLRCEDFHTKAEKTPVEVAQRSVVGHMPVQVTSWIYKGGINLWKRFFLVKLQLGWIQLKILGVIFCSQSFKEPSARQTYA